MIDSVNADGEESKARRETWKKKEQIMKTTFTITEKNFDVELLKSFAPVSANFDCDATSAEMEDVTPNHIEAERSCTVRLLLLNQRTSPCLK